MTDPGWSSESDWTASTTTNIEIDGGVFRLAPLLPDNENLHAHYDATRLSLSDGASVSTWTDESGNGYDLTAGTAPTFKTGVINGNAVVRFDGSSEYLDVAFAALSQPVTVYTVVQINGSSGSNHRWFDSESDPYVQLAWVSSVTSWVFQAGSELRGGSFDNNPHIFAANADGANSFWYQDGVSLATGAAGTNDLNGIAVGSDRNQGEFAEADIGEILVYSANHGSATRSEVEAYLSDKWGITV